MVFDIPNKAVATNQLIYFTRTRFTFVLKYKRIKSS